MVDIIGEAFSTLISRDFPEIGTPTTPASMSFLYEKSRWWRWVVASSKSSTGFFLAFGTACVVVPWVIGDATMRATQRNKLELEQELLKRGREDSLAVGRLNNQRLGQLLQEIERKENTEDRYVAALRGETLTGTPEARVRGGGGTSYPPPPPPPTASAQEPHPLPVSPS